MLCGEGETVVMLASENAFDLAQVPGAQWASNNNTFVRSRRGAGLRKHSRGNSRTPFVVVLANKTTNCQGKFAEQNTGTRGGSGLFKKWCSTWSKGFCFLLSVHCWCFWFSTLTESEFPRMFCAWSRVPLSRYEWTNEWMNVQVSKC